MRMPPNLVGATTVPLDQEASMRGGMRMPPNDHHQHITARVSAASMRGGMRMPPNRGTLRPAATASRLQ